MTVKEQIRRAIRAHALDWLAGDTNEDSEALYVYGRDFTSRYVTWEDFSGETHNVFGVSLRNYSWVAEMLDGDVYVYSGGYGDQVGKRDREIYTVAAEIITQVAPEEGFKVYHPGAKTTITEKWVDVWTLTNLVAGHRAGIIKRRRSVESRRREAARESLKEQTEAIMATSMLYADFDPVAGF